MKRSQRCSNLQSYLLIALPLVFARFAIAQNMPSEDVAHRRRVVVSIPDRMLAVIEGDTVLQVFPVAVGADTSPSPSGDLKSPAGSLIPLTTIPASSFPLARTIL